MRPTGFARCILLSAAIVLPFLSSDIVASAKTTLGEIVVSENKPLILFNAAKTGNMRSSIVDTNNPETIKLIEEAINRANQKLASYQQYAKLGKTYLHLPQGKRLVRDLVNEVYERLCDYNIRLSDLISRDEEIVRYCSSFMKAFKRGFSKQYLNDPLVEDPNNTMLYYPEIDIILLKSLYKLQKHDAVVENRKLVDSLKNGLKTQLNSLRYRGYYHGGIHTLTIGELVAVINDLNLILASHESSADFYKSILHEFTVMMGEYEKYSKKSFRYDSDSPLAREGVMLAGIGRFQEAENKFEQSLITRPLDSLSRLTAFEDLLIKQRKYDKALEISDFGRYLRKSYAGLSADLLDNHKQNKLMQESRMTIHDIKRTSSELQTTIVEYSLHQDNMIYIWVVTPNGNTYVRQVFLSDTNAKMVNHNSGPHLSSQVNTNILTQYFLAIVVVLVLSFSLKTAYTLRSVQHLIFGISVAFFYLFGCQSHHQLNTKRSVDQKLAVFENQFQDSQKRIIKYKTVEIHGITSLRDLIQLNYALINQELGRTDIPKLITSLSSKYCKNSAQCLHMLNQILINPIADVLPTSPNEHIAFVLDGQLSKVPFAALKDENGQYLIEKHTIYYAPSIQDLKKLKNIASRKILGAKRDALIVGNPIMPTIKLPALVSANGDASYATIERIRPKRLQQLDGAENEAKEIAKIYRSRPLIGKDAQGGVVLKEFKNADIIHLATHGFYTSMGDSVLALAPERQSCIGDAPYQCWGYNLEDGFLTPSMLGNPETTINAQLIVLSACETGLAGDSGYQSFIYELIRRGVPSIVVSLWQIPDSPSDKIMIGFHKYLQSNQDKARALRLAMLDNIQNNDTPGLWAAFVLYGDSGKIDSVLN